MVKERSWSLPKWFTTSSKNILWWQRLITRMFPARHVLFNWYSYLAECFKLSEGEFWKRYFQSKLFDSHRASIRSAAAQNFVKEDPIFDKYLEKEDNGILAP
jgi:hypothetical protein